jgi:hypothetical protein
LLNFVSSHTHSFHDLFCFFSLHTTVLYCVPYCTTLYSSLSRDLQSTSISNISQFSPTHASVSISVTVYLHLLRCSLSCVCVCVQTYVISICIVVRLMDLFEDGKAVESSVMRALELSSAAAAAAAASTAPSSSSSSSAVANGSMHTMGQSNTHKYVRHSIRTSRSYTFP